MKLTVIGCSGSFPGPDSPATCYLVREEHEGREWAVVLDLGSGSLGVLQRYLDPSTLDAILVTHLHPDHFLDLNGLYVMQKYRPHRPHRRALPVYGPSDWPARLSLSYYGRETSMDEEFSFVPVTDGSRFDIGPFSVLARRVNHPIEAYGFRLEAGGKVLVYTGDTDSCEALSPLMSGADLVLTDCAFVDGRDPERGIHLTGSRAAQAAADAGGVKRLMLTHMPTWNDREVCRAQAAAVWPGVELVEPDATYHI